MCGVDSTVSKVTHGLDEKVENRVQLFPREFHICKTEKWCLMPFQRCVLGISAAFLILCACTQSPQAKEAQYLAKGRKEFARGNYGVAVLHFKNALSAQPRDAEPYFQLGLVYQATNDLDRAASYLRKATGLNPGHTAAQLKLAAILSTSRVREIVQEAEKRTRDVLQVVPEDSEALNLLAVTELRLGKPESAEAHLEQVLRKAPNHLTSSVVLAQARLARKDVAGAEQALKEAAIHAPKSPEPSVYLSGLYLAQGKTAEAEEALHQALRIDPKHGPALMNLGAMQARAGQKEQAEQTYRQVATLPEKQYRPMHALYLFQAGKREEAIAEFERLAADDPADRNVRTALVKAYLAVGHVTDAERVLTAALEKNGLDVDALLQRSRIYLGSAKLAEAETDLNQVLHFRSDSAEAHYLLSKVRQARENTAMQKQELGEALRLDAKFLAARAELAQVLIATGGAQAALKVLDETPQEQKLGVPILVQRNWALLALGQKAEARSGVDGVLSSGRVADALLQDAILRLDGSDYTGARASAEEALQQNPDDVRALNILVRSYAAQNQFAAGLQKVREHARRHPESAGVQILLGQFLSASGDRAAARGAFEAAATAKPDLITAKLALADLDTAEGRWDDARNRLSAVMHAHPGNIPGHMFLAQLELAEGQNGAAIEQYRKVVAIDEKNVFALNGLAYLLSESKQPDEAIKYAQQAKELRPDNPAIDDTLGWTYFQKGLYAMAVTHLENAVSREGTARRRYHLAMAYYKAGDSKRGRETLNAALRMDPQLPEAQAARRIFGMP